MRMNEYICIYNAYIYIYILLFIFIDIFILCVVKEVKHGTCATPRFIIDSPMFFLPVPVVARGAAPIVQTTHVHKAHTA